jgi:hypothetical protein
MPDFMQGQEACTASADSIYIIQLERAAPAPPSSALLQATKDHWPTHSAKHTEWLQISGALEQQRLTMPKEPLPTC